MFRKTKKLIEFGVDNDLLRRDLKTVNNRLETLAIEKSSLERRLKHAEEEHKAKLVMTRIEERVRQWLADGNESDLVILVPYKMMSELEMAGIHLWGRSPVSRPYAECKHSFNVDGCEYPIYMRTGNSVKIITKEEYERDNAKEME